MLHTQQWAPATAVGNPEPFTGYSTKRATQCSGAAKKPQNSCQKLLGTKQKTEKKGFFLRPHGWLVGETATLSVTMTLGLHAFLQPSNHGQH